MKQHPFVTRCLEELGTGLKMFGEYTFDDKGPMEVMPCEDLEEDLRDLGPVEAAKVILELSKCTEFDGRPDAVARELVQLLDDWDDWDTFIAEPGIEELY